jgi:hypothetical protein
MREVTDVGRRVPDPSTFGGRVVEASGTAGGRLSAG